MNIWKKGKDSLKNGFVLGALLGAAIVWGNKLYSWLLVTVPSAWLVLGSWSLPIYLMVLFGIIGFFIDKH